MQCPYCVDDHTKVIDSRPHTLGRIRRRRHCVTCGERFVTIEQIASDNLLVRKRSGAVEPFSRSKIMKGITKAASVYALPPADVNAFIDRVVHRLQPTAPGVPIPSTEIGHQVLRQLEDSSVFTDIARIRYAIVFLGRTTSSPGFRNLDGFLEWLEGAYGPPRTELPLATPWRVRKRQGHTEAFSVRKLERSIGIAVKGRGTDEQVRDLAARVGVTARHELQGQAIVTSQQIAGEVLKTLLKLDAMAYLRYASAAKLYASVDDFWLDARGIRAKNGDSRR